MINFTLTSCSTLSIRIGTSAYFNDDEIKSATEVVKEEFNEFEGCELTSLWYDEEDPSFGYPSKDEPFDTNEIVLFANFKVDDKGGDVSFNPNTTYNNWRWRLRRENAKSDWKVVNYGYGVILSSLHKS